MPSKWKPNAAGQDRPPDFEGQYYDGNAPRGTKSTLGQIRMWWKLRRGSPADPYLSGLHVHVCSCGKSTAMRLFLTPKTHASMPSAAVFQSILTKAPTAADPDDIFTDQEAREAGI